MLKPSKMQLSQKLRNENRPRRQLSSFAVVVLVALITISIFLLFIALKGLFKKEETPKGENIEAPAPVEEPTEETSNEKNGTTYKVQSGDTLYDIGRKFGIDYEAIAKYNDLNPPYTLKVGEELKIPPKSETDTNTNQ